MSKIGFAFLLLSGIASGQDKKLDTSRIDELTGLKGKLNEQENVYKVSSPRTDIKISVDKWEMPPFMGLTSWAACMPGRKGEAMRAARVNIVAIHSHMTRENPRTLFLHYWGRGKGAALVKAVKAALEQTK